MPLVETDIHIHHLAGEVCVACGDADDGTRAFVTDPGYWNTLNDRCTLTVQISQSYTQILREDPRTNALEGERYPDFRKVRDPR